MVEAKPSAEPASPLPPSARPSPFTTQPKNDWLFRSLRLWGVVAGNVVSAAATRTETRTSTAGPREAASFGIASSIDIAVASRAEGVSVRAHGRAGIGGGQAGLDGRYEVLIMAGPIYGNAFVGVAPRLGLGGGLRGNQRLFRASVALPRADLAFDWHPTRGIFVETGITGAPTLIGRSNVDETRRPTGGAWQAGFFGIVGVRWFSAVVQGTRELARSAPGSAIDTLDVHACLSPIAAVVLCPHALLSRGSAIVGGNAVDTRVRELSLTLGYGAVEAY